jgi:hypothetical protein
MWIEGHCELTTLDKLPPSRHAPEGARHNFDPETKVLTAQSDP